MKKLRKILLSVSAACALACTAAAFAACGDTPAGHQHSWDTDYTIDVAATCTTDGSKSIHCKGCDETKDAEVIPAGHSWEENYTIDVPAGCTTDGLKTIHCANCEKTKDPTVITAGHVWETEYTVDTPATCINNGSKSIHCANCDATKEPAIVPAGHVWSEWEITQPTNTKTGTAVRTCSGEDCNATDEQKEFTLPKLTDASYEKTEDTATCGDDGVIIYTYTHDEDTYVFEVTTKASGNHTVAEWTTTTEPTCGAKGVKSGHCSVCDKDVTDSIPATGKHTPTNAYFACSVCGKTVDYDQRVMGNNVTANFTANSEKWFAIQHMFQSAGYIVYTYTGTGPIKVIYSYYGNGKEVCEEVTLNNGDAFYLAASTRGTGYIVVGANSEEDVTGTLAGKWQSTVPAMPTKLTIGTQTVNAAVDSTNAKIYYEYTATEEGTNNYVLYCDDADASIYKKDATDEEYVEITLPYSFTLAQGEKIGFQMLIKDFESSKTSYSVTLDMGALHEHTWGAWTEKTPATCTAAKVEQRDCTDANCPSHGHQEQTSGEALGHSWSEWTEKTPATCTTAKVEERTCTRTGCNENETRSSGTPAGHSLTETAEKPAECTTDGTEAYWTCSKCSKLYSDENGTAEISAPVVIPAGHNYAFTTVEEAGVKKLVNACSGCGDEKSSHNYDTKVDLTGSSSVPTVVISDGTNLVHVERGTITTTTVTHYASFTADKTGTYTFAFEKITDQMTQFSSLTVNGSSKTANTDYTRVVSGRQVVSITITLNEGDVCNLYLGQQMPSGVNESYYLVTVSCAD